MGKTFLRLCISKRHFLAATVELNESLQFDMTRVLESVTEPAIADSPTAEPAFPLAAAKRVSQFLLGTDGECLSAMDSAIYAPSFLLPALPLGALPNPSSPIDRVESLKDVRWIGITHGIQQVVDPNEIVALRKKSPTHKSISFLGFGNPDLNAIRKGSESVPEAVATRLSNLEALPETEMEIRTVGEALGGSATILTGAAATELEVRRLVLSSYSVISFATHAVTSSDFPSLGEAALVLTPSWQGRFSIDDGLLTVSEIGELDIDASIVILSACKTAVTGVGAFGPETNSLSAAFLLAGARSTLQQLRLS